jgi:cytosine/uracil/thiamine/allantoin permease
MLANVYLFLFFFFFFFWVVILIVFTNKTTTKKGENMDKIFNIEGPCICLYIMGLFFLA